jgi:hypothetical protein
MGAMLIEVIAVPDDSPRLCNISLSILFLFFLCQPGNLYTTIVLVHHSDPYVVIVLALVFIASIFFLHITARIFKALTS